jgi:hypothetical protein
MTDHATLPRGHVSFSCHSLAADRIFLQAYVPSRPSYPGEAAAQGVEGKARADRGIAQDKRYAGAPGRPRDRSAVRTRTRSGAARWPLSTTSPSTPTSRRTGCAGRVPVLEHRYG